MKLIEQITEWVKGESIHNDERDECTPDFSCCVPEIKANKETRLKFAVALVEEDEKTKNEMLMFFLRKLTVNKKVSSKVRII